MATIECNNAQDSYTPTENGDALPEEKALSIDYSEDLWLASEDSSGPYAQQPSKVITNSSTASLESHSAYSQPESHLRDEERSSHSNAEHSSEASEKSSWREDHSEEASSEVSNLPAAEVRNLQQTGVRYVNGETGEQNGMDYNTSGSEKDFAQLMPAGSYVEGAVAGAEPQDKTFTALMPAAALGVNGEIQPGTYTNMLASGQTQMVFYGSGDQIPNPQDSEVSEEQQNENVEYSAENVTYEEMPAAQVSASNGTEDAEGQSGETNAYEKLETFVPEGQVAADGNFTVLSPAGTTYTQVSGGSSYHISTLPFVQNGTYQTEAGYSVAPFDSTTATTTIINSAAVVDESGQPVQATVEQPIYAEDGSVIPDQDLGDADGMDDDEDMEDSQDMAHSMEMSEFMCPMCSESFADQVALDEHVENHPPIKTFVCETCGKGFATRRYLRYHRKNHCKRAGSYEGRTDGEEAEGGNELKRFMCNVCSRPFRVLKCMKVHKKKKHGILKDFTCHNCAVTFNSSEELMSHPCEPETLAPQPVVPLTPSTPSVTPQPIHYATPVSVPYTPQPKKKKKLKNAKPACDICGKTFADRISVDIHRVKHIEEELYPCDMCDNCDEDPENRHLAVYFRIKFFTDDNQHILEDQKAAVASTESASSSSVNIKSESGSTPVHHGQSTPIAGASTPLSAPPTPVYLTTVSGENPGTPVSVSAIAAASGIEGAVDQTQQYSGEQPNYIVNQYVMQEDSEVSMIGSEQGMSSSADGQQLYDAGQSIEEDELEEAKRLKLKQRIKTHCCDVCNKTFTDATKLELHYKSNHLEDRPFHCNVCEKSFFTKWKLQRHMLSHLEQKPHSCPMCSKSFVERGKLEAHYRTHLGTKPFKCDHCQKAFTVKSQLTIHVRRIHSTDQPFACLECGKAFLWKSGLDKHMRKHTREKPHICQNCGQKYSNKSNLIQHMSKAHNERYVDPDAK